MWGKTITFCLVFIRPSNYIIGTFFVNSENTYGVYSCWCIFLQFELKSNGKILARSLLRLNEWAEKIGSGEDQPSRSNVAVLGNKSYHIFCVLRFRILIDHVNRMIIFQKKELIKFHISHFCLIGRASFTAGQK